MKMKKKVMTEKEIAISIRRMAAEITEKIDDHENLLLLGIKSRGVFLAKRIAAELEFFFGSKISMNTIDISLYRDDLSLLAAEPIYKGSSLPENIDQKTIIICDDVLFTGRTVYKALQEIYQQGEPTAIKLAMLIDRGHHQIPLEAEFVGRQIPTSSEEVIKVSFHEKDEEENVKIMKI